MDDGSNNGKNITLNTHCFSREEQRVIQRFLKDKFGIEATIVKDRDKYKIAIGVHECKKFIGIVKPYVIKSMNYKILVPVTT